MLILKLILGSILDLDLVQIQRSTVTIQVNLLIPTMLKPFTLKMPGIERLILWIRVTGSFQREARQIRR